MDKKIIQRHRPAASLPAEIAMAAPDGDPERAAVPAPEGEIGVEADVDAAGPTGIGPGNGRIQG